MAVGFALLVAAGAQSAGWDFDPGAVMPKETNEMNQQLPIRVDSETEMQSAAVFEKAVVFKYVMLNANADWLKVNNFISEITREMKPRVCSDPWSQDVFKRWPTIIYSYSGKDGVFVGKITINRNECG
jgi:hypothetical protein